MGIKGLNAVIADNAPNALKALEIKSFFGRKVAIDASMSLYQFLIAVRQQDGQQLQNETGETTSHLMGMFYRTLRIVDNGIKPLYVFDGAPPKLKSGELAKRIARNAQASADAAEAKETGTAEDVDKFSRRTVRVTKQHNEEAKLLLKLMGIPYVEAPCEAEACCAQLAKEGKVYAAASEDMDTLCFNAPVLLRHLTFSEARKEPISEIQLSKALDGLGMDMNQFIDMCILLGCDYCDPIRGIGPKKAHDLVLEHKNIETILENLKGSKYEVPADWPYKDARELFRNPDVNPWVRVGMSPLETELRERMKRNKEAAAQAATDFESSAPETDSKDPTEDKSAEEADGNKTEDGDEEAEELKRTEKKVDEVIQSTDSAAMEKSTDGTAQPAEKTETKAEPTETETDLEADSTSPEKDSAEAMETSKSPAKDAAASEEQVDPYETAVIVKDLSASQSPEIPRKRILIKDLNLEWVDPDVEGLIAFLCSDKGFAEDRVRSGAARLQKATKQKQQGRLDGFFKAQPKSSDDTNKSKRKMEDKKTADKAAKKQKTKPAAAGGNKAGRPKGK